MLNFLWDSNLKPWELEPPKVLAHRTDASSKGSPFILLGTKRKKKKRDWMTSPRDLMIVWCTRSSSDCYQPRCQAQKLHKFKFDVLPRCFQMFSDLSIWNSWPLVSTQPLCDEYILGRIFGGNSRNNIPFKPRLNRPKRKLTRHARQYWYVWSLLDMYSYLQLSVSIRNIVTVLLVQKTSNLAKKSMLEMANISHTTSYFKMH